MFRRAAGVAVLALVVPGAWAAPAGAATATCGGQRATIVGSAASEVLLGTPGDDVIAGLGGSDTINGRGGDDRICGNRGADQISGGRGADRLFGGLDRLFEDAGETARVGDRLFGGPGDDRLFPGRDTRPADDVTHDSLSWEHSARALFVDLADGIAIGQGDDRFDSRGAWVVGSRYADIVDGSPRADRVDGGPGRDWITTFGGNDRVNGGPGADQIRTRTGDDQIFAGAGNDLVEGGPGDDEISADAGADRLYGGDGNDFIDNFASQSGAVRMYGQSGRDHIVAQLVDVPGARQVFGGGLGAHDELSLFTNQLNPSVLAATGEWDMATGTLVWDLDGPVSATAAGFERADLATYGTAWSIRGTTSANRMNAVGTAGTAFEARAGNDTFWGSQFADVFNGGAGTDRSLGMGAGTDTCIAVEAFDVDDCETVTP